MKKRFEPHFEELAFDADVPQPLGDIEFPASQNIFLLLGVAGTLMGILVMGRIGVLNLLKGNMYVERADANVFKEVSSPARRGIITDRYGTILAENESTFSVSLNVAELLKEPARFRGAVQALAEVFRVDPREIEARALSIDLERESSASVVRNLSPQEIIAVEGLNLAGVAVEDDYVRRYPEGDVFAHIVGYTGIAEDRNIVVGKSGLEAFYDTPLRGHDGKYVFYRDAHGEVFEEKAFVEPAAGQALTTTIDAEFQRYFYHRLKSALDRLGRRAGVGIAIDPRNGEILSLVSLPSFDNNVFADRRRNEERQALLQDPGKALFNRAISGAYNTGSTIKPLVALAALKEGLITPETEVVSKGFIEVPNPFVPDEPSRFLDWKAHGRINLAGALARSSNVYFYGLGGGLSAEQSETKPIRGLGILKLKQYWEKFGFGVKTNVDLPSENAGFLPDPDLKKKQAHEIWRLGDTYNVSIGQGDLLVTPLQLVSFFGALGNGGRIYEPHLALGEAAAIRVDFSDLADLIDPVRRGLLDAVAEPYGTAFLLHDLAVTVAGKTGSAQVHNNTEVNAFFIGYAPAEDPSIAILVLVEHAREGSLNATPIARDVLTWYYENRLR